MTDDSDAHRAERLGISVDALQLARESEYIDLHLDTFIGARMFGYDLAKRHGAGPLFGRFMGHVDFPRALWGQLTGGMWSITTNIFRRAPGRWKAFLRNVENFRKRIDQAEGVEAVTSYAEYKAARARGSHACMLAIQGGNAIDAAPDGPASIPDRMITRITIVHLTHSALGASSTPFPWPFDRKDKGLTTKGREFVEQLNEQRIFVDVAHAHPKTFWDVVEVHDKTQPLVSTHTGVNGVRPSWRNLDDDQLRAIADTGGTAGIIFHAPFLTGTGLFGAGGKKTGRIIIEHMKHIIDTVGEDHVSVGSDFDGLILPPRDISSAEHYPRLVHYMLEEGWSDTRVKKILGENFLRCFESIRPA